MKKVLTLTPTYRHRIEHELSKIVRDRLAKDERSELASRGDYELWFVVDGIVEVVMGEAEIEDSGPVERMANEIAAAIISEIRARSTNDWMMDLVLYNRFIRGAEIGTSQQAINKAISTVQWLGQTQRVFT